MSWLFKSKDQDSLRRDARAPAIAKHGKVVSVGIFHKRGRVERAYTAWTKRRFDIHDDCTLVYYDGDVYKGEIDLHEVTITFSADPENSVFSAKPYTATGAEIALDLYCPHGSPEAAAPRRSVFGTAKKKSTDRTLQIILESPQDAALLCSTIATLDPDGLGNAQDFAAVQGWMMPRRAQANPSSRRNTVDTPKKAAMKMDSESEGESGNGESDGESDQDEIDKMSWGALRETQESRSSSDSASTPNAGELRTSGASNLSTSPPSNEKQKSSPGTPGGPGALSRLFPAVDSVGEEPAPPAVQTGVAGADAEHETPITAATQPLTSDPSQAVAAAARNDSADDSTEAVVPEHSAAAAAAATSSVDSRYDYVSPQLKRRHSSFLNAVWNKLLPLGASLRGTSGRVHAHGLLYVLTEPETAAVTDRAAMLSVHTELQWQPRMFEITSDSVLRIQGGSNARGASYQCRISLVGVHVERMGCAQVWAGRSRQSNRRQKRYAGSSNNMFVDSLVHAPQPQPNALSSAPPAGSTDGLRNRKVSTSASLRGAESDAERNTYADTLCDTLDCSSLGAVRFSEVKTVPLVGPTAPTRAASVKSVKQLPEEAHNPRQRLLHTPVLRLTLPRGDEMLVTFLPPDLQYANVLRDDRYNLSYALHLQVQLQALEEATTFIKALKEVAPEDLFDDAAAATLETSLHELQGQRDSAEIAQHQFTSAFNGSAAKSASNVFIFIWCVWLMLTTLRPSAMNLFVFAIATYAFIYAQKWLSSEDGDRVFAAMQQRMREIRIARGDTVILMKK